MIKELIKKELIEVHLQAIVSIRTKRVYGFEALCRCTYDGMNISPNKLFYLAKKEGMLFELDKFARVQAIKKFSTYYRKNQELLLFLNFESNLINDGIYLKEDQEFIHLIDEYKIPYSNLLLEIKEDEIFDSENLDKFCINFKEKGFLIVLDDFGIGSSNFDRINLVRPDIIKIDKALFHNIKDNHINQEVIRAIASMSSSIGTRALAEGVEELEAITICMSMGINLFQGFFFHKPQSTFSSKDFFEVLGKVDSVGSIFKNEILESLNEKRTMISLYNKIIESMTSKISTTLNVEAIFYNNIEEFDNVEAVYIIDEKNSKQIGETLISKNVSKSFRPNKHGDEHYLKEYYYITKETKEGTYLSDKYISYATGNICKTFAKKISVNNEEYIICIDIVIKG
jgi:EAL domain-containing protein (putative c-di-GMP-specific phosphodiesterase class I)